MRCGTLAATAIMMLVALSGCVEEAQNVPLGDVDASGGASDFDSLDSGNETAAPDGNETQEDEEAGPSLAALLTVSVDGANATFTVDADGADNATWTLDLGDDEAANGTELPATVVHAYAAGNHTATLTVSAGDDEATATVNVTVAEAGDDNGTEGPPAPVPEEPPAATFPWTQTLSQPAYCTECSLIGSPETCVAFLTGANEADCVLFALPEGAAGRTFTLSSTIGDPDMMFAQSCDWSSDWGDTAASAGPESGTIPAGYGCVVAWEYDDFLSDLTLAID